MQEDPFILVWFAIVFGVVALLGYAVSAYARNWIRARKLWVYVKVGDVLIRRPGRLTEEGLEVDGKVYPVKRDSIIYIKSGRKTEAAVIVDSTANAVYTFKNNELEREAPPELLSKLALKRILRQLTRREIQVMPFVMGILVGVLVAAAAVLAAYQYVVIPAKQESAAAQQILGEYNKLQSDNARLQQQLGALNQSYHNLLESYHALQQQLQLCNATVANNTVVTNQTTGG